MFGLFKKKPPTKAGLAYQKVQAILETVFELKTLARGGGAASAWEVEDKSTGEHLFILYVGGLKGSSSQEFHDDDIERLRIEVEGIWSGSKLSEAKQASVKDAVAPYLFENAELIGNSGRDWRIGTRFEIALEPDARALVDELQRFADACRRAYRILDS